MDFTTDYSHIRWWFLYCSFFVWQKNICVLPDVENAFLHSNTLLTGYISVAANLTSNSFFRENKCPLIMNFQFSTALTMKIRSRSLKSNQFLMSQLHIMQYIYSWKFGKNPTTSSNYISQTRKCYRIFSFCTAVTLKIRSRSPKSNQSFIMSQLYIMQI